MREGVLFFAEAGLDFVTDSLAMVEADLGDSGVHVDGLDEDLLHQFWSCQLLVGELVEHLSVEST